MTTFDWEITDEVIAVSDADSFIDDAAAGAARRGLLVGGLVGSCRGRRHQGCRQRGPGRRHRRHPARRRPRLPVEDLQRRPGWPTTVSCATAAPDRRSAILLAARPDAHPGALVPVHPDETVAQAIELLHEYDVSQLPVVQTEPPLMAAEVALPVAERDLLERAGQRARPGHRIRSAGTCRRRRRCSDRASRLVAPPSVPRKVGCGARARGRQTRCGAHSGRTCSPTTPPPTLAARPPPPPPRTRYGHRRRTVNDETLGFETLAIHRLPGPRPGHRGGRPGDLPDLDLQARRRGRHAGRLRVLPHRQPDADRARDVPGRAGERRGGASVRLRDGGRGLLDPHPQPHAGDRCRSFSATPTAGTFRLFDRWGKLANWGVEYRSVTSDRS